MHAHTGCTIRPGMHLLSCQGRLPHTDPKAYLGLQDPATGPMTAQAHPDCRCPGLILARCWRQDPRPHHPAADDTACPYMQMQRAPCIDSQQNHCA